MSAQTQVTRWSAFGPLPTLNFRFARARRCGKGASGQPAALDWGGLRFAPTALRCSVSRPRRRTRFVRCAHYAQTTATSQLTIRASRGATSPVLLGAPEARRDLPERAFADTLVLLAGKGTRGSARRAVPGGGDFCGDEKRRPGVGARSALRQLTRRSCLSGVSAANAVSSATRPRGEHRSGVGAQRRPPQHEPLPGTACRAAPKPHKSGRTRKVSIGPRAVFHCLSAFHFPQVARRATELLK